MKMTTLNEHPDKHPEEDGGLWWVIHTSSLMRMLKDAHAGKDPDLVMLEEYAEPDVDDSRVELANGICTECGQKLPEAPR
jgi:hypothetical protein